jgi:long-chain acyl-CoA synthetase
MWERMGVKLVQGYGLTETAPILTVNRLEKRRLDSPGLALDNVLLQIAEGGEIQAKGPNVFTEYWHNGPATRDAFTSDGWFKTGDTGKLQDGWLFVQGRLKFAIVLSSGLKVFPEDVELVTSKQPVFKSVCVVGVHKPDGEEVQAIVISDKSDHDVNEAIAESNSQLASFQHIAGWRRWPDSDFPRTRLLKIDRKRVQEWANTTTPESQAKSEKPKVQVDPILSIIRLSLRSPTKTIKETDRLADLGLDSLRRLNVVALVEEQLGVTIEEEYVTHTTTVAKLRKLVADSPHAEPLPHRVVWTYYWWVRLVGNFLREVVMRGVLRIWVKITVEGKEELENLQTPALFIFNHVDDFDCPVVYQALPHSIRKRLTVAQADDVMREHKLLAFISRLCFGSFNMNRSEPFMPSLEYVCQIVDQGRSVVLAPEGRISTDGKLQDFKSGIGLLAVELGIPVVIIKTIGLTGTVPIHAKWPKKHSHVTVRIGKPAVFGRHMDYDEVTKELHHMMDTL